MKSSRLTFTIISLIIGVTLMVSSCKKDKAVPRLEIPEGCDTLNTTFSGSVQPIFQTNCAISGCHDAGTATLGYVWESYNDISTDINIALKVIRHEGGVTPMPYGQPQLPDSTITIIECWVAQGMPEN